MKVISWDCGSVVSKEGSDKIINNAKGNDICYFVTISKRGYGRKWELITNTAEFVDPANDTYFTRQQGNKIKKKKIQN